MISPLQKRKHTISIPSISYIGNRIKLRRNLQPYSTRSTHSFTIEDWTAQHKLSKPMVDFASDKVGGDILVQIYPRRMIREVWRHEMEGKPFDVKPYAFRAFARGKQIVLFDDATETRSSLLWLLLHEIGHIWVTRTPKLRRQFRSTSLK